MTWPTWDEWLAGQDDETSAAATRRRDLFASLGADDPESWARSEISEDIPQLARFLVLRSFWDAIDRWRRPDAVGSTPAGRRLLAAGAAVEDLQALARYTAFEVICSVISTLDEGQSVELGEGLPDWSLQEMTADGALTGRTVGALHESLLETDPSGQEGKDLWD